MKRLAVAALPLAALLTLTGCIPTTDTGPLPSDTSSSPADGTTPDAQVAPEDDATVIPVPPAASSSESTAITAAEHAVATFARPDLPYQQWINELYPLMSQAGAAAYEGTDPANIPVRQVTGDGTVLDGATDVALIVEVPTDVGPYTVSLSRSSTDAPWLADRIRPAGA
jgi:hypothetical protein